MLWIEIDKLGKNSSFREESVVFYFRNVENNLSFMIYVNVCSY